MGRKLHLAALLLGLAATAAGAAEVSAGGGEVIVPGEPTATATLHCIGVFWSVEADDNANAVCDVAYRKAGDDRWRAALPLHRKPGVSYDVEKSIADGRPIGFIGGLGKWNENTIAYAIKHWEANYLAGSIFNLDAATEYEVRLRLSDPDTPLKIEKLLNVATRPQPVLRTVGRKVAVLTSEEFAAALVDAQPGDTILMHEGTYQGPFLIEKSGRPDKPIVIRAAEDAAVVIRGDGYEKPGSMVFAIKGSFIHLHGVEIRDAVVGVNIGYGRHAHGGVGRGEFAIRREDIPEGISITRCRVAGVQHAIVGTGNDCYVADNDLEGLALKARGIDWSEGEGVEIKGWGSVVCHNRMRELADGVSLYPNTADQDVYNNDVSMCSDDGIELDYCDYNNRVWGNKFNYAGNNGISFQPHIGGPGYIIRNQVIGFREGCIKDRYASSDVYFFNNTFVGHKAIAEPGATRGRRRRWPIVLAPTDLPRKSYGRNNLWLVQGGTDVPVIDFHHWEAVLGGIDLDHEGLGGFFMVGSGSRGGQLVDPEYYPGSKHVSGVGLAIPINTFREVSGTLEHYTPIYPDKAFEVELPAYRDWRQEGPEPVMRLKAGAAAIDAGVVVPNVTETYSGKSPDLGALEFGEAEPCYGPRPVGTAPYDK